MFVLVLLKAFSKSYKIKMYRLFTFLENVYHIILYSKHNGFIIKCSKIFETGCLNLKHDVF